MRTPRGAPMRLAMLEARGRLREVGWLPWTLLVAWLLVAHLQEPALLRTFGIHLSAQATWVGFAVLAALLLRCPHDARLPLAVHLGVVAGTLLGLAVLQLLVVVVADALRAAPSAWHRECGTALRFVVVWFPMGLALSTRRELSTQLSVQTILISTVALSCCAASASAWSGPPSLRSNCAVLAMTVSLLLLRLSSARPHPS